LRQCSQNRIQVAVEVGMSLGVATQGGQKGGKKTGEKGAEKNKSRQGSGTYLSNDTYRIAEDEDAPSYAEAVKEG
jgi:hypothetical protein